MATSALMFCYQWGPDYDFIAFVHRGPHTIRFLGALDDYGGDCNTALAVSYGFAKSFDWCN